MAVYGRARDETLDAECRGGWWGDTLGNSPIGSKLWTLSQRSSGGDAARKAEQYLEGALAPLASLGIINEVTVNASLSRGTLYIDDLNITKPSGTNNYSYLWEAGCGV